MYKFIKIKDSTIFAYHVSNDKFDKFDISKKNKTSSKGGVGYNFQIGEPYDNNHKYTYYCQIEMNNPMSLTESTIPMEKWNELIKVLGIEMNGLSIASEENSDVENYYALSTICDYNNIDLSKLLDLATSILGKDGYIRGDFVLVINTNAIKILEVKENY